MGSGSLKPRFKRHCASKPETLSSRVSTDTSAGWGGAMVQRYFIAQASGETSGSCAR